MNNFQRALLELMIRRPRKLPALYRLATGAKKYGRRSFENPEHISTPPITVSIRSTYRCNLECKMCGQWGERGSIVNAPKEVLTDELTTDEIKKFIDEIAWFRPYLFFTGGEPTIRPDLQEMIRHANSRHLLTALNTNATYLEEKAESIMDSGLDYLFVSLDGPPEIDDKIRIGRNSAERAFKGIQKILELRRQRRTRLPIVQVQTTLTEENQDNLYATGEYFQQNLDIDTWGLNPGVFTTFELNEATSKVFKEKWGIDQKSWGGFIRDMRGMKPDVIHEQIDRIMARKWKFRFRPYHPIGVKGFRFQDWFEHPEQVFGKAFCATLYVFAQLQPNGQIATCGSQPDYTTGNIRTTPFMDIWNGMKYREFRAHIKKEFLPSCARCWALYEYNFPSGSRTDNKKAA